VKKAPKLTQGSTIGVVALASSCNPTRISDGLKKLEDLGFKTKVALDPCEAYGKDTHLFSSDTPQNRAKGLRDLFIDPEVKVIISARGAYGSIEILPYLDFKVIAENPKCLVGFSDITAVLNAITTRTLVPSIHGPMVSGAFADDFSDQSVVKTTSSLIDLLAGKVTNPFEGLKLNVLKSGVEGEGRIVGGSLSVLTSLIGTPWEPDFNDAILFLEDVSVKPFRAHRLLLQLKQSSKLDNLVGVVLGDFVECDHPTGPSLETVFKDIFSDYKYQVLSGLPAGHGKLNLSVPLGVKAAIKSNKLEIFESIVELS